jgi:hypothetical protein
MRIKVAIGVLLVLVLVFLAISLLTGGDDEDDDATTAQEERSGGGGDDGDDDDGNGDDAAPRLRTLATERAEGPNAVVAVAADSTEKPREFWLRVSAAPKQVVKGSWNVSCTGGGNDLESFEVTPPHLMKLTVPTKNAASCIAGASAQLKDEGRLKLAILRDR